MWDESISLFIVMLGMVVDHITFIQVRRQKGRIIAHTGVCSYWCVLILVCAHTGVCGRIIAHTGVCGRIIAHTSVCGRIIAHTGVCGRIIAHTGVCGRVVFDLLKEWDQKSFQIITTRVQISFLYCPVKALVFVVQWGSSGGTFPRSCLQSLIVGPIVYFWLEFGWINVPFTNFHAAIQQGIVALSVRCRKADGFAVDVRMFAGLAVNYVRCR